jgi:NitT/TauT family transport system substrate-binding protein
VIRPFFRVPTVTVAVMSVLLAAGCGSGNGNGNGNSASSGVEKPDLTVAAVPALDSAGVYIAELRGLFAAQGLHVTVVPAISSATVIAGQLAGKYDVTVGAYPSYIEANAAHKAKLRVLAAASIMAPFTQEVMVPAGSPIQSVAQLRGKTIGVNALGNIGTLLVSSLLADNSVPVSSVHFIVIPFPLMAAALKAHRVDAAWLPEPFITGAEESIGAKELADADQGAAQNLPVAGFIVTQAWAHKYPKTAAAFQRAILEAQAIASTNLAAVQQAMAAKGGLARGTAQIATAPQFPVQSNQASIQRVADLMEQFGILQLHYDITPMLR